MSSKIKGIYTLEKFGQKGEKTGWTYIHITKEMAQVLFPDNKKAFRVKCTIDNQKDLEISTLPMGAGDFIIPVRKDLQKILGKSAGQEVSMVIELCKHDYVLNKDFVDYLQTDANAYTFFKKLTGSHQRYFSKWIDSAKTTQTRVERIARAVDALSRKQGYVEMIRSRKIT